MRPSRGGSQGNIDNTERERSQNGKEVLGRGTEVIEILEIMVKIKENN